MYKNKKKTKNTSLIEPFTSSSDFCTATKNSYKIILWRAECTNSYKLKQNKTKEGAEAFIKTDCLMLRNRKK